MITEAENGEIKAPRTRGDEEAVQLGINTNRSRGSGQASRQDVSKPFATYRDDRPRGNFVEQRGQAILGGILSRLISKTLDLIEESENRTAELKNHLEELKELYSQFQENKE
ncbi:hypothetical protein [Nostoc flagelliforme]|uniref:hypothetical protein n=1 Tax=Nostoc flagelliforme TaxID=1306274 RepID=UPI0012FDB6E2|nr:hypothetical protein [Nostoc flagelliforme]